MDPALWEAIRESQRTGEEIEAIVRLDSPNQDLPDARIVSRFGRFATVRLDPGAVLRTRRRVRSLKAARLVSPGREPDLDDTDAGTPSRLSDLRRQSNLPYDGTSIIVAAADWSFDFNHPNLKKPDGTTRILAMWDQRDSERHEPPQPYGYGVLHTREDINRALASPDPYATLSYYPGDTDVHCSGSHGTHVTDIAAGSGAIGPAGIAPNADLVLVHLADRGTRGLANLGDSVRIMEAVDFISRTAGNRNWVTNLSVGRHGGPHNGRTLAEMAFDELLAERPGRFIVQSAGNYQGKDIHSCGRLDAGETRQLGIYVDKADYTPNELEVWTSAGTELSVEVESPTRVVSTLVSLGESAEIVENGALVGTIYNRAADPNSNKDNHVNLFLYPAAPPGFWKIRLHADAVSDGIYHAWLERDDACSTCQTRFAEADVNGEFTTGTLANSRHPLVVGAYNNHSGRREIASFSSSGPTRDGRMKPDVLAPGVRIIAARSRGPNCDESYRPLTRKSGTSMAAPHVTGTVALLMQSSKKPLWSHEIRELVLENSDPVAPDSQERYRAGRGYLSIPKLIRAVKAKRAGFAARTARETHMKPDDTLHDIDADAIFESTRESMDGNQIVEGYNVIAWPGKTPEATPEAGDILVRVAEGEPGLGQVSKVIKSVLMPQDQLAEAAIDAESAYPGFYAPVIDSGRESDTSSDGFARRILNADGRMPSYQLLLRPSQNAPIELDVDIGSTEYADDDDPMESLENTQQEILPAVAGAVAGAFAGAIFTPIVSGVINAMSGGFTIGPASASHIWRQSPPGLPLYRRIDRIRFPLEKLGLDKLAVFNLELTYDGHSVHEAAITFRSGASRSGSGDFKAVFRAQALGGSDASRGTVLQILFPFSGNWNPFGPGNEDFTGSILVSGNGRVRARMQPRARSVRVHHAFGERRTLRRAQPQSPSSGLATIPTPQPRRRRRRPRGLRAISKNCKYGCRLGWLIPKPEILRLLGIPNHTRVDRAFVEAVNRWQSQNGLRADGIIGPDTWSRMQKFQDK